MTGAGCHIPGCERDGVHVDGNGYLCDRCRQRLKNGERPTPTATGTASERDEPAAGLASQPPVEQEVYPTDLVDVEQWLTWKPTDDGRKVPRAPYEHRSQPDRFVSAQDPDIWTDRETAQRWADALHEHGLAFSIPSREDAPEDSYVLIDYDDVRDPETGTIHPTVREHLAQADSYADISTSGTGIHIVCRGELPEEIKSIDAALPAHDDFPDAGIEVYDAGRYMAMTGAHIAATPVETRPAQEFLDDLAAEYATVPEGTPEELTREPVRSREAIADVETTIGLQAVFDAIQHVQPSDIRLRSPVTEERADGSKSRDPSWASSESGTRLAELDDGWVYRQGMVGLDALQVVALEERLITSETEYPSGEAFWDAVDALRERGAHIPEYIGPARSDGEPVAVLPSTPKARALGSGWDWTADGRSEQELTVAEARERTVQAIVDAIESLDRRLVEALPTMGKSYGTVLAAARTGVPMTILTGRGRTEQYEQFVDWCREHGLRYYRLPAFTHDCPCATGEHGGAWEERVMEWYRAGATPQAIHMYAEEVVGRPLPCQAGEGQECPYTSKWRFDAAEIDVLIGHYTHAYNRRVTEGRTVAVDEFPEGAYEQGFDAGLASAVTTFLQAHEEIPFADYTDLIEHRDDQARRGEALCWFEDRDPERDVDQAFAGGHAAAPLVTYTLLAGPADRLGNGWERVRIDERRLGCYDREEGAVWLLQPPELQYARAVVALDGTPTQEMWERVLGTQLTHRPVLSEAERREYLQEALNLQLIRTSEYIKPYGCRDHIDIEGDAALLEAIEEGHDHTPDLITSTTALEEYRSAEADVLDTVGETRYYGNVRGSNRLADSRVGAVIGSNHFGDDFVQRWGAYAGEAVEHRGKGEDLTYGAFGDRILQHMREHETLQAALRFGRDGNGAVVYVHTDTLPEWVPIAGEGRVLETWSDGMRQVVRALEDEGTASAAELAGHPAVAIGERQVLNVLEALVERGVVCRQRDPRDGRRAVWTAEELNTLPEHGDVDLAAGTSGGHDSDEVHELARMCLYTWEFANCTDEGETGWSRNASGASAAARIALRVANASLDPPD